MSGVKLNTAGGGSVLVQPASSIASDVTVNVPSVSTTLVGTNTTQTLTNKTLTTPNIDSAQVATVSGTAPLYMCRAWVNFNGTGTVAIRASGNVSSITDHGTGDYSVNFTNAMPDANYEWQGTAGQTAFNQPMTLIGQNIDSYSQTASSFRIYSLGQNTVSTTDNAHIKIAVHR